VRSYGSLCVYLTAAAYKELFKPSCVPRFANISNVYGKSSTCVEAGVSQLFSLHNRQIMAVPRRSLHMRYVFLCIGTIFCGLNKYGRVGQPHGEQMD